MPDITMCTGEGCVLKDSCYRYTAQPSEYRQSYFVVPPFNLLLVEDLETGKNQQDCRHYWSTYGTHETDNSSGNQ